MDLATAGKTTLTEKLLLFGGAIQLAGTVKARGTRRRVLGLDGGRVPSRHLGLLGGDKRRDEGLAFNLLDKPGHQEFGADTCRTLNCGRDAERYRK
jgi:peptide chain release factor 3